MHLSNLSNVDDFSSGQKSVCHGQNLDEVEAVCIQTWDICFDAVLFIPH